MVSRKSGDNEVIGSSVEVIKTYDAGKKEDDKSLKISVWHTKR